MRIASVNPWKRCRPFPAPASPSPSASSSWSPSTPPRCNPFWSIAAATSHSNGPSSLRRHSSSSSTSSSTTTEPNSPNPHHHHHNHDLHNLRYPDPPTTEHDDQASYAAYAERTGLDTASTTYVGTQYEYAVAASLRRLGFDLRRVGGRADRGIDLLGTWTLPSPSPSPSTFSAPPPPPLRILLQCKASASRSTAIGPQYIRELEGAFAGAPVGWRRRLNAAGVVVPGSESESGSGVLGLLVAQRPATKGIRDALGRSRWPMGYVACAADGRLQQMLWNRQAEEEGLEGLGVGVRYFEVVQCGGGGGQGAGGGQQPPLDQELVLTWRGKPAV